MENSVINTISSEMLFAICNTLIHSLWQGLVLAIVIGLTIILTKRSKAVLRYNLLIFFLFVFTVATATTFYLQFNGGNRPSDNTVILELLSQDHQPANSYSATSHSNENIFTAIFQFIHSHSFIIVFCWLFIICIKCIQFTAGILNVFNLKQVQVLTLGPRWDDKVDQLAKVLGIKNKLRLLQSGIAKCPMVIGYLKPVILIPIGLITTLTAEEVEAVLLHELSHIRRKDYLINLFQNLLEILFFFNPALLWLSSLIRVERENCCDDIAIAKTGNKEVYIKALISCEEYHLDKLQFSMRFAGNNKNGLFARVRRIISSNNYTLNGMEKGILTIGIISLVLLTVFFSSLKAQSLGGKNALTTKIIKRPTPAKKNTGNSATGNSNPASFISASDTTKKTARHKFNAVSKRTKSKDLHAKPGSFSQKNKTAIKKDNTLSRDSIRPRVYRKLSRLQIRSGNTDSLKHRKARTYKQRGVQFPTTTATDKLYAPTLKQRADEASKRSLMANERLSDSKKRIQVARANADKAKQRANEARRRASMRKRDTMKSNTGEIGTQQNALAATHEKTPQNKNEQSSLISSDELIITRYPQYNGTFYEKVNT